MFRRHLHRFCVISLVALILLSLTGRFLAIGDSFAVFRPHMLTTLAFLLILPSAMKWRWSGLLTVLICLAFHLIYGLPYPRNIRGSYQVYQKNLFFRIQDVGPIAKDIRSLPGLDFVTLQEITDAKRGLMAELKPEFPYQHICPFKSIGGTAVLSKRPIIQGSQKCFEGGGMTVVQIDDSPEPVWVVSAHLNWPFPYSQRQQVQRLLPKLAELQGPVIIGGDFNNVPWSYAVQSVSEASETWRLPGTLTTFHIGHIGLLGVPIDHVLGPRDCAGKTELRPKLGSDHHGVLARIACRQKR